MNGGISKIMSPQQLVGDVTGIKAPDAREVFGGKKSGSGDSNALLSKPVEKTKERKSLLTG